MIRRVQFEAQIGERGEISPIGPLAPRVRVRLQKIKGKRALVTVEPERKRRSLPQNAYMWGVVYPCIAEWSGHDVDEIHEAMKALHLPARETALPTGEVLNVPGSTARLDSAEFTDYLGRVKRWASEQGLYIPEPDEW